MRLTLSNSKSWRASSIRNPEFTSKIFLIWCLLPLALGSTARAQDTPRVQVFGGYSYTHFDSKSFGYSSSAGLNGGTIMVAGNVFHEFGGLAQVSVSGGSGITVRDMLFGPQFLYPRGNFLFFAHGLFGRSRASVRVANEAFGSQTEPLDTQNEMAFGGGVDMNFRHHLSIRVVEVDYVRTQLFQHDQSNLRFSTGIVYHMGSIRRRLHRAPSIPTP
jgi:hypothetical protein